jgi:hypothetical protein
MQGEASRAFKALQVWYSDHPGKEQMGPLQRPFSRCHCVKASSSVARGYASGCLVRRGWVCGCWFRRGQIGGWVRLGAVALVDVGLGGLVVVRLGAVALVDVGLWAGGC